MAIFTGKAVIVTGAGSGIGRAAARAFAREGATVVAVGRTRAKLDATAEGRPGIRPLVADVNDARAVVDGASDLAGRIDVLVNNAAANGGVDVVGTNLLAPIGLVEAAAPHLPRGGVVVNVSTAIGQRGWPYAGGEVYAAFKAALDSLTRSWAVQFAPRGVRVVGVAPGPIDAPMSEGARERLVAHVPLGRVGTADEVAFWIVQLARPEAAYTTGVVLPVDGGALVG
ncbi:SDR family oxidoreductase [Saccharothrix longispora]|uniref:SDR family NAD(P)-dependent oxidoreductase n=1 Tax=Saccharothrix longispora TaxID=33920 RepID=UPI0028FD94BD|nr:SDR family oxidoreductase [Saccharothrix longispora]MBY8851648.1 SDR family oxidoreductase [Saccharothrix sp. MB29]MDU0294138.1 SDR family oxidoreductase [Saccharothrix longispora]